MKKDYETKAALAAVGVTHYFQPGQLVLVKQPRIGKLRPKVIGPFYFRKYRGPLKAVAKVANRAGRLLEFAAAHLIPLAANSWGFEMEGAGLSNMGGPHGLAGGVLLTPSATRRDHRH